MVQCDFHWKCRMFLKWRSIGILNVASCLYLHCATSVIGLGAIDSVHK
jgi:hypothetical protein